MSVTEMNLNSTSVAVPEQVTDGSMNKSESNTTTEVIDDIDVGIVTGTS